MMKPYELKFEVDGDDFSSAGEASGHVKKTLKALGYSPETIRRVTVGMYEAEINMVIHANGGVITTWITPEEITAEFKDQGPGIPNVELAMQEGWSTASDAARNLGFGAGMGLPNIKKYTDEMKIDTVVGEGTTVTMKIKISK